MRVEVDYGLCESNGVCMGVMPEVFQLGDTDELTVLRPEIANDERPLVMEAVRQCPRQAISLRE
jgi:ferredoxin